MEAVRTFEMSVYFTEPTRRYIPEGLSPSNRAMLNFITKILEFVTLTIKVIKSLGETGVACSTQY
jgi:hypothetical protein